MIRNLNTSYVKVPVDITKRSIGGTAKFKYILCKGSRKNQTAENLYLLIFKYILCKGSRWTSGAKEPRILLFKYILRFQKIKKRARRERIYI